MKVSIIIPAYECENTLRNTVNCILNSGLADYEVVIIDDGSKDGTAEICDELSAKYENVRAFHQANAGVSAARNRGLKEAKGEYVMLFDADDAIDENAFSYCMEILDAKTPDMLIFGMSFDYYGNDGKLFRRDLLKYSAECDFCPEEWAKEFMPLYKCNSFTSSCNKFIRRDLINKNAVSYDENYFAYEDLLFVMDCLIYCERIYVLPEAVYRYALIENDEKVSRRLSEIPSLSEFMKAFEERVALLEKRFGADWEEGRKMLSILYRTLLSQRLCYASLDEIKAEAEDFNNSRYKDIRNTLADNLRQRKYLEIFLNFRKSVLRHSVANKVKRSAVYRHIKRG